MVGEEVSRLFKCIGYWLIAQSERKHRCPNLGKLDSLGILPYSCGASATLARVAHLPRHELVDQGVHVTCASWEVHLLSPAVTPLSKSSIEECQKSVLGTLSNRTIMHR